MSLSRRMRTKTTPMQKQLNRIALAAGILLAAAGARAESNQWAFATSANPALAAGGGATATIAPGPFSTAWINNNAILGSASGVWDLGQMGNITIANTAGTTNAQRSFTVKVTQWYDGGIFNSNAAVSLPGATLSGASS